MIEFNPQRAFLNHNVLKNAVFAHLTDSPDLISARRTPMQERLAGLAKYLLEAKGVTKNAIFACETWRHEVETGKDVPTLVREFFRLMTKLDTYEPAEEYPSDDAVEKWLAAIDAVMFDLDGLARLNKPERTRRVMNLWEAAIILQDTLHCLNPHTPDFWTYMRNKNI